jgi:hypothetical protein
MQNKIKLKKKKKRKEKKKKSCKQKILGKFLYNMSFSMHYIAMEDQIRICNTI